MNKNTDINLVFKKKTSELLVSHESMQWVGTNDCGIVQQNQSCYQLFEAARMCLWIKRLTLRKQRWSVKMIVPKSRRAMMCLVVFGFYIYDKYDFVFVSFTKMYSQALSEDAAWDFLIIFTDDFYSIFTILIFYTKFSFH